ncbi:MAG TPA: response regulator transcription factor [Ktedonobacteraceae bacterium]|nr:response regulator transcription factor [Ktedonobacteraceae bacterium]
MTSAFFPSQHAADSQTPASMSESAREESESTPDGAMQMETFAIRASRQQAVIRVLVVDDHELIRRGLCAVFDEQEDFEVAGQTGTGNAVVILAKQLQPDIVLLDIFLGNANGLDIAQQLQRACPETRVVIVTGYTDDSHLLRAMRIGVHGYLQKALPTEELLEALRSIYRGERVIGEARAITRVLSEYEQLTKEQERVRSGLTDLEIELIRLAAEGCSNKEIAARQFWSEVTVKRKMQDIYRKLQVTDRAQAVAEAMRMGLI